MRFRILVAMVAVLEMVDIRRVVGREMDALLLEETVEWEQELDWDFRHAAEAIRGCIDTRELTGCALLDRGEVVGYGYSAFDGGKGMVGDIFVREGWRDGINEVRLLGTVAEGLLAMPGLRRMESQMLLVDRGVARTVAESLGLHIFDRMMMSANLAGARPAETQLNPRRYRLERWAEHHFEGAAGVITLAYEGHVDSLINDQYHGMAGARRFLRNILKFPSAGMFFSEGSFVALDVETGRLAGMILVSFVGPVTGHITQLCVVPGARAGGLGSGLMRVALESLAEVGVKRVSLTVTDSNLGAVRLYEGCGFQKKREFAGLAWGE